MKWGVLILPLLFGAPLHAGAGLDLQAYPAGGQALAVWAQPFSPTQRWLAYAGVNVARRWSWGRHDDERGWGPGLGLGWLWQAPVGWLLGARVEAWDLQIDWRDASRQGSTRSVVLQPSVELGWRFPQQRWGACETALSLGQEINVSTDGEEVGQGPILRLRLGWRR